MNPLADYQPDRILPLIAVAVRRDLTEQALHHAAATMTVQQYADFLGRGVTMALRTQLAVEHLPDTAHPFTVQGVQQYPVWQTWWDHFKSTYQLRWWARWWVQRHPPRHRWTDVTVNQRITVPLRAAWKFPHIPHVPADLGRAYLHTWTDPAVVAWTDSTGNPDA